MVLIGLKKQLSLVKTCCEAIKDDLRSLGLFQKHVHIWDK